MHIHWKIYKLFILVNNPFGILALICCTKVLLLSWERINSERNKEEVKEVLPGKRERRQCKESKKINIYSKKYESKGKRREFEEEYV
jgi:hypothetical protein